MKKPAAAKTKSELDGQQKLIVFMLIIILAGFLGWAWEFLFAETKGGFDHFYVTGGNLLPWINIYAYGAVLILITCTKLKKHPLLVFAVGALTAGLLELLAGWLVFTFGNGTRYWDYTESWIGTGSINGFVCPASVIAFGLGALALVYCLLPQCTSLVKHVSKKTLLTVVIILFSIVILDDVVNLTLKNLGRPGAPDFYSSHGWVRLVPQHKD
jgi:uncharacterized membrane protein